MKRKMNLAILIFINFASAFASATEISTHLDYPVHILPGSPSKDYQAYLQKAFLSDAPIAGYVQQALGVGERNLQWLEYLNAHRPDSIALTKPGQLPSHPINRPNAYSPAIVEQEFKSIAMNIPESMRKIIFEDAAFSKKLAVPVADYILWARKVDALYQSAARWTSSAPYLAWYTQNKVNDIRGYYFLNQEADLNKKLSNWNSLNPKDQSRLSTYLVNLCENSSISTAKCASYLNTSIYKNSVQKYYGSYVAKSKRVYDRYFKMGGTRGELKWTRQNENLAVIPFRQTDPIIEKFLAVNIEDEWKWLGWQLKLDFKKNAPVHVEFQPGVVPHVNGIAGDTIVMDKNASLNEWDVQWTIRHEFGHVLGFTDCYVEFYDSSAQQMVNYQIDVTNLMCSRAGKFKQTHFDEMKANYLR